MKRILLALGMTLWAIPAFAQSPALDIFRVIASHSTPVVATGQTPSGTQLSAQTRIVKIVATTDVFLSFGASGSVPTASVATGSFLPLNTIRNYLVSPSGMIAVRSKGGTGTVYIDELSR